MAVIDVSPYQLNGSKIFPLISALIVQTRPVSTLNSSDWREMFLGVLEKGQVEYGDGFQYVFPTDAIKGFDTDFDKGENVLKQNRPSMKTVAITTDRWRSYSVTNTEIMNNQMFENGDVCSNFVSILWGLPEYSARREWTEYGLAMLDKSTCVKEYVDLSVTTTGADGFADEIMTMQSLAQEIQRISDTATVDSTVYTNGKTLQERRSEELIFIYNKKYLNRLEATVLAPLFKGEVILSMANIAQAIAIPQAAMDKYTTLKDTICIVTTWERFNLFYKYQTSMEFTNAATMSQTIWRHVSGGLGEVDDFFACMFIDGTPPAPKGPQKIESNAVSQEAKQTKKEKQIESKEKQTAV